MNRIKVIEQVGTAYSYINYKIRARHKSGHGIHSPFVFEFISKVLFDKTIYSEYRVLDEIREELKNSNEKLLVHETGARSKYFIKEQREVAQLLKISSVDPTFGRLLFRVARYYHPATIIELGTSIGISALYMAKGSPDSQLITIEGNGSLCDYTSRLFKRSQADNIILFAGLFNDCLKDIEQQYPVPELVFIDGDHNYESTLDYYDYFSSRMNTGILIFDDINWSKGMRNAWKEIKQDKKATVTIDLFYMGIVILNDAITPGNYTVRF